LIGIERPESGEDNMDSHDSHSTPGDDQNSPKGGGSRIELQRQRVLSGHEGGQGSKKFGVSGVPNNRLSALKQDSGFLKNSRSGSIDSINMGQSKF
jgi:hypothetical protein